MSYADVCMRSAVETSAIDSGDVSLNRSSKNLPAGERYWEYILIHVYNLLVDSRQAKCITESISGVYTLKEDKKTKHSHGTAHVYLGTNTHKFRHPDANKYEPHCWSMSGNHYVKNIIDKIKERLKKHVRQLNSNQKSPFT